MKMNDRTNICIVCGQEVGYFGKDNKCLICRWFRVRTPDGVYPKYLQ